jgi:hypothetical protein
VPDEAVGACVCLGDPEPATSGPLELPQPAAMTASPSVAKNAADRATGRDRSRPGPLGGRPAQASWLHERVNSSLRWSGTVFASFYAGVPDTGRTVAVMPL